MLMRNQIFLSLYQKYNSRLSSKNLNKLKMDSPPIFNTTTTIAAVLTILLYALFFAKKARSPRRKTAPEPAGAWPIIGHLQLFTGSNEPLFRTLATLADQYGPVFTLRLGVHPTLVVSNWEVAKELFTTNDMAVSSRPPMVAIRTLSYDFTMFAFAPYGPYWREIRKIANFELLSNSRIESLKHVTINEVEGSIRELYKLWKDEKSKSGSLAVEMKQWIQDLVLNVVVRMIAGKKYFGANAEGDEKEVRRLQEALRRFFDYLGMLVIRDALPFLGWLDIGGHEKAMKRTAKELDGIFQKWLEEHKQKRSSGEVHEKERDFIDVMLTVLDGKNLAGHDTDAVNKATSLSMIAGGSESSAVTTTWALSQLLNNREALKKVQEELDICVGRERMVKDTDINKLVYFQAAVKETLRLCPPAALAGSRLVTEDCTIGGYHVPKDTWIMVNQWKIQIDSRVWPNPLEFRPERFLTTHKDVDVKGLNAELIPFGGGRRVCPGINLALQMVHLTLASFLHAFEFSTPANEPVDLTEKPGFTNAKATPLEVRVSPRLSPHLYA